MQRIHYLVFFLFILLSQASAQTRKAIFGEIMGNAPHISVNYDQRFQPDRNDGFGFRAGLNSSYRWYGSEAFTAGIPLGINYLYGEGQHALEIGLVSVPEFFIKKPRDPFVASGGKTLDVNTVFFHANFNLGYRLQPIKDKGLFLNALWTPTIIRSKDVFADKNKLGMFGLGIGYSFK